MSLSYKTKNINRKHRLCNSDHDFEIPTTTQPQTVIRSDYKIPGNPQKSPEIPGGRNCTIPVGITKSPVGINRFWSESTQCRSELEHPRSELTNPRSELKNPGNPPKIPENPRRSELRNVGRNYNFPEIPRKSPEIPRPELISCYNFAKPYLC